MLGASFVCRTLFLWLETVMMVVTVSFVRYLMVGNRFLVVKEVVTVVVMVVMVIHNGSSLQHP